jgi:uncharacterized protein
MITIFNIFSKLFFGIFIFNFGNTGYSQNIQNDIALIKNKYYTSESADNYYRNSLFNNTETLKFKHKNFISRYNPLSLSATAMMFFYQHVVSPQFSRTCLYESTCSNFSKKAIAEFGLVKGIFLSADRLMRCNIAAMQDIPVGNYNFEGYAIDEPKIYHLQKK